MPTKSIQLTYSPPSAPKPPCRAFLLYRKQALGCLQAENPSLSETQLSILVLKQWDQMPEEEKEVYRRKEFEEEVKYRGELSEYFRTERYFEDLDFEKQRFMPVEPMDAKMVFMSRHREKVRKEMGVEGTEVGKVMMKMWKKIGKGERRKYQDEAKRAMKLYKKAKKEYIKQNPWISYSSLSKKSGKVTQKSGRKSVKRGEKQMKSELKEEITGKPKIRAKRRRKANLKQLHDKVMQNKFEKAEIKEEFGSEHKIEQSDIKQETNTTREETKDYLKEEVKAPKSKIELKQEITKSAKTFDISKNKKSKRRKRVRKSKLNDTSKTPIRKVQKTLEVSQERLQESQQEVHDSKSNEDGKEEIKDPQPPIENKKNTREEFFKKFNNKKITKTLQKERKTKERQKKQSVKRKNPQSKRRKSKVKKTPKPRDEESKDQAMEDEAKEEAKDEEKNKPDADIDPDVKIQKEISSAMIKEKIAELETTVKRSTKKIVMPKDDPLAPRVKRSKIFTLAKRSKSPSRSIKRVVSRQKPKSVVASKRRSRRISKNKKVKK